MFYFSFQLANPAVLEIKKELYGLNTKTPQHKDSSDVDKGKKSDGDTTMKNVKSKTKYTDTPEQSGTQIEPVNMKTKYGGLEQTKSDIKTNVATTENSTGLDDVTVAFVETRDQSADEKRQEQSENQGTDVDNIFDESSSASSTSIPVCFGKNVKE